jgi:hypothetical protein
MPIHCGFYPDDGERRLIPCASQIHKKEQTNLTGPDTWVDIHLDKSRIRHYKGTDIGRRMEELGHITLRMVKAPLPEGREEALITNVPKELIKKQSCKT